MAVETTKSGQVHVSDAQLMQLMLQKRFHHAKHQRKDYSHLFRPKSRWELIRLTLLFVGIQFTYAAQTAFVTPILLAIGLSHTFMTMTWAFSPALGFFCAPMIASISDQIRLEWGRRRPVLLTLGVGLILGLLILPHGKRIGLTLGDLEDQPIGFRWGIMLTVLGMILIDFNVETCNGVARTYFMDMCIKEDHTRVLTAAVMIGGLGGLTGYILGSIDWSLTNIGSLVGSNEALVFAAVVIIVIIGLVATLTSFREVPLPLMEQDELLKPISAAAFEVEKRRNKSAINSISGRQSIIQIDTSSSLKLINEDIVQSPGIKTFLRNFFRMPKALGILYFTQFLSHLGYLSYCLYFTDFVGRQIFQGDVTAPENSQEFRLYNEGVRFGCLGMAIFILSSSVYSIFLEWLIRKFGIKPIYVSGLLLNGIGMLVAALTEQRFAVFVCSFTMGIEYSIICSLPFLLISHYHMKNSFEMTNTLQYVTCTQKRGFGADISMLSSMLFLAQILTSLTIGSIIDSTGTTTCVMYSASLFSGLAALSATRIVYMDL
ncbi:proton-associated sugar transporter A-like [Sabethes cyaneus]|uniref:proton-associated sugar transporter A-like n=1 Tax=Sabethes cyaneus TaxID=53552 RepID=UPI00237E2357|nr:proton-associated sugar transporter A-like [Sabethes cyaneus]